MGTLGKILEVDKCVNMKTQAREQSRKQGEEKQKCIKKGVLPRR